MKPAQQRFVPLLSLKSGYLDGVAHVGGVVGDHITKRKAPAAPDQDVARTAGGHDAHYCRVSKVQFDSAKALREHYHTDWYRYNLKRSVRGQPPTSEAEFDALVEGGQLLDEDLSGSDSDDDEIPTVGEDEEEGDEVESAGATKRGSHARLVFSDADGRHFLVWREALGPYPAQAADPEPRDSLLRFCAQRPAPLWVVVLCRGGHFAAAAFEVPSKGEDVLKPMAHRCFHRYVTRRKAGGRQSVADAGKTIKSAGSSMRRHNEAMLAKEVGELLMSWVPTYLKQARMVWIHAPGPANAALLFGANGPFQKSDPKVRGVPFMTARPTLSETSRVVIQLSRAEYPDEREVAALLRPTSDAAVPSDAARQEAAAAAAAAQELADSKRAAAEAAHEQAVAEAEVQAAMLPAELHEAAEAGDADRVLALLKQGYDPAVRHVRFGFRVAYDLCKDRETRISFRKHRAEHPDQWDWQAAHVPAGLTEVDEAEREERERQKAKEKKKKADKARKERRKLEEAELAAAMTALLEATSGSDIPGLAASIQGAEAAGCDEEALSQARAKLEALKFEATDPVAIQRRERERRAAAAEARMSALNGGK